MFNTKKFSILILFFSLFLIVAGCTSNSSNSSNLNGDENENKESKKNTGDNAEKITLKFASASPANAPYTVGFMEPFMKRVTELTDGQVEFDFYPAEQLGKAVDLLDLTANGVTDIGYYGASFYPSKMPIGSKIVGLPGLGENAFQQTMAFHELSQTSPMLEKDFLSNGVRPILSSGLPPFEFYTRGEEIKVPSDLKGKKVRATGGADTALFEYMGATPVQINTPDMYETFDQGIIDAIYLFPRTLDSYGLQELIKYGSNGARFGAGVVGFVINENVYQRLPENVKDAITQAGQEVMKEYSSNSDKESNAIMQQWIEELGIEIYELTEEEQKEWQDLATEFNNHYLSEQKDKDQLLEVLEGYKKLLSKYQ